MEGDFKVPTLDSTSAAPDWLSPLLADIFRHQITEFLRKFEREALRRVCTQWRDALPLDQVVLTQRWLSEDAASFYPALKHTTSFTSRMKGAFPADFFTHIQRGNLFQHLRSVSVNRNALRDDTLKQVISALSSCDQLTSLNLDHNECGEQSAAALARLIYHSKTLATLSILLQTKDYGHLKQIFDAIERNSSLETLIFGFTELDDSLIRSLSNMVTNNPTIKNLNLASSLGHKSAPLFEKLRNNSSVRSIILFRSKLDSAPVMSALSEALKSNTCIKKLTFERCGIQPEGAASLGAALCVNSSITSLDLNINPIGDLGLAAVASAIESPTCALKYFKLGAPQCSSTGIETIAKALKRNKSITKLDLAFLDVVCVALGSAVGYSSSLREVSAMSCDFGDTGVSDLAQGLAQNSSLISLKLNDFSLTHQSGLALGEALGGNTALQSLYISPKHPMAHNSMYGVALGLQKNQGLRKLSLVGDMDAQTREALIKAAGVNTHLRELHLRHSGFVFSQSSAFFDALLANPASSLEIIDLDRSDMAFGAARHFADALRAESSKLRSIRLVHSLSSDSDVKIISEALAVNHKLTSLDISSGQIGSYGVMFLIEALRCNTTLQYLNLSNHVITQSGMKAFKELAESRTERTGLVVNLDGNRATIPNQTNCQLLL